ncbi:hypothetical protein B0H11DRAFT_2211484 [Mycena galericulata]|nr:hypothetical protein B0H11DRAFT_2211484 [Mycena galericulata]
MSHELRSELWPAATRNDRSVMRETTKKLKRGPGHEHYVPKTRSSEVTSHIVLQSHREFSRKLWHPPKYQRHRLVYHNHSSSTSIILASFYPTFQTLPVTPTDAPYRFYLGEDRVVFAGTVLPEVNRALEISFGTWQGQDTHIVVPAYHPKPKNVEIATLQPKLEGTIQTALPHLGPKKRDDSSSKTRTVISKSFPSSPPPLTHSKADTRTKRCHSVDCCRKLDAESAGDPVGDGMAGMGARCKGGSSKRNEQQASPGGEGRDGAGAGERQAEQERAKDRDVIVPRNVPRTKRKRICRMTTTSMWCCFEEQMHKHTSAPSMLPERLWPEAKKPRLFGFGTKAKAKPKFWPGLAFGLAWPSEKPKPGQKAMAFDGHF